jgi:hypothetical protein
MEKIEKIIKILKSPINELCKWEIPVRYANPDVKTGISNWFFLSDFPTDLPFNLRCGNGGDWLRDPDKGQGIYSLFNVEVEKDKGKIIKFRLNGYSDNNEKFRQQTSKVIREEILKQPCSILGTNSRLQLDHRNGRKNDPKFNDIAKHKLEDFQSLHVTCNVIKRERCKECKEKNERYKATQIGHLLNFTKGSLSLDINDVDGCCVGCFWYETKEFYKQEIHLIHNYILAGALKNILPLNCNESEMINYINIINDTSDKNDIPLIMEKIK